MSHIVTPDSTIKTNGVKKTKTPRQYDSILKGALALSFAHRVELRRELNNSIGKELEEVSKQAEDYITLAKQQ